MTDTLTYGTEESPETSTNIENLLYDSKVTRDQWGKEKTDNK